MAFRVVSFNTFAVLLCIIISALCAPAKNSDHSQRNKEKPKGTSKISLSSENPCFMDEQPAEARYHGNPFLGSSDGLQVNNENSVNKVDFMRGQNNSTMSVSSPVTSYSNPFLMHPSGTNLTYRNEAPISDTGNIESQKTASSSFRNEPLIDSIPTNESKTVSTKTISELKCEEYSNALRVKALSLVGTNTGIIEGETQECRTPLRLVVGGETATPGEFPHMVGLGRFMNGNFTFYCGGSLISSNWVLTAAHCTYGPNGSPNAVRVGFHSLEDNLGSIQTIKTIVRHPTYKPPAMYADVALIELNNNVTFNRTTRPACLYQKYDTVPMRAWVTGWGVTEFGGDLKNELQKAQLQVVDNVACSIRHNGSRSVPHGVTPSMICAGDPEHNWSKDTCQGDSGGPLQVPHPKNDCLVHIIGITSFGAGCAVVDTPGVYTRVSHFLDWIEQIVWPY